jgi:acetaldehyde dehydrogenase
LLLKIQTRCPELHVEMMVGIDPDSDGLARARARNVRTTHEGIEGLIAHPCFAEVDLVFDATSAGAHMMHHKRLSGLGKRIIDLTPAAVGPYVVPVANLDDHLDAPNINLVTCGGQATIPMVWAVSQVANVEYAEIIASIASRSAGPGTRANIDEFTVTTARGLEDVGGAQHAKAIIILNPANPPMMMRDTVYVLCDHASHEDITRSIEDTVARVAAYVPGYRLVQQPVFESYADAPLRRPGHEPFEGLKVSVFLEVEGAGDYLPAYAGNLDIMTSAAVAMGQRIAEHLNELEQQEAT